MSASLSACWDAKDKVSAEWRQELRPKYLGLWQHGFNHIKSRWGKCVLRGSDGGPLGSKVFGVAAYDV